MKTVASVCSTLIAVALLSAPAFAEGRELQIVNYTDFEIVAIFGMRQGATEWGENELAGDIITAGETQTVDFDDGSGYCMFSIMAVFDDGEELVSEDINICDLPAFTYY
ncbi:MAG: hypothetical protein QGI08_11560 [Paracoccaceae bacterium]|nr:hypothetical protein [Paracoccaceae bacterium]MDP7186350.1 hypothetical protein [Paracoccaceae bacterium]